MYIYAWAYMWIYRCTCVLAKRGIHEFVGRCVCSYMHAQAEWVYTHASLMCIWWVCRYRHMRVYGCVHVGDRSTKKFGEPHSLSGF